MRGWRQNLACMTQVQGVYASSCGSGACRALSGGLVVIMLSACIFACLVGFVCISILVGFNEWKLHGRIGYFWRVLVVGSRVM